MSGLATRLAAAMARIKSVPKNGSMVMSGKKIPYVANDDLMEILRPILAAQGIALTISVDDVSKGISDSVGCMLTIRLACDEEVLESRAYGEGRTFPIAQTYAVKYWLLRSLLVGSGEDDEGAAEPVMQTPARPRSDVEAIGEARAKGLRVINQLAEKLWPGADRADHLSLVVQQVGVGKLDPATGRFELAGCNPDELRTVYRALQEQAQAVTA